mgnify:CR=1 FL=1
MSSAAGAYEKANPRSLPQPLTSICAALAVLGVVAFVAGLVTVPQTAWLSFHTNFIYTTMLAGAGLTLAAIYTIVGARWPGPWQPWLDPAEAVPCPSSACSCSRRAPPPRRHGCPARGLAR